MAFVPNSIDALLQHDFDDIIDVRSPSEFAEDHVPGAINLPVLSDDERARVGTIYVQESPFLARKLGAALVARNAAAHLEGPLAHRDGSWKPLVYCWRGGQRSGSFASILQQIGWRVNVLEGGYRSWRHLVASALYEKPLAHRLILLDGNTGTAKTDVLARLKARDIQVIDLEGLANHRGSALGALGEQPAQKTFESRLSAVLSSLDPSQPTLVEAESSKIGRINLPPRLFDAMKAAPRIEIKASVQARAGFLVEAYSDMTVSVEALHERLDRLIRLQGRDTVLAWQGMASEGAFEALAAELIVQHYDPRYAKVRARIGGRIAAVVEADALDVSGREQLADRIVTALNSL